MSNKDSKPKKAGRFWRPSFNKKKNKDIASEPIPRITTENIHEHREEVLGGAKKFVYPLKHSRHKIVIISVSIFVALFVGFMSYILLSLYKFQDTSKFTYQVTKILPLPIARVGGSFVSYEDYLFELRHYIHYFENQQELDFSSQSGQDQLKEQKKRALDQVINETYIKKIAKEKGITVSSAEIDKQIELLRSQNRLGGDSQVFEDVLRDFWGWTINDFRRSINNEILKNKVVQALDPQVRERADKAKAEIKNGKDFAAAAKEYSDDETTKEKGGELGFLVSKSDRNIPPQTAEVLFNLKPGEVSEVIDLGYGLEIIKNLGTEGDKVKAARIFFAYKDLDSYLNDYKDQQKARVYIKVN
jgi:parvulin-like peptidyl-prolyl isomerase